MRAIYNIIEMLRKLRSVGVIGGSFMKYTLKYFGFVTLMNGCYNYGCYNAKNVDIGNSILLSKLYAFWLYLFEINYSKIYFTIVNNIAYFLHLPFNYVYFLVSMFLIYLVIRIILFFLGWYTMYVTYRLKKEQIIINEFLTKTGETKTVFEYDDKMYNDLLRKLDEQAKEIELLKSKIKKNG